MKQNESQLKPACNKDSLLPTKICLAICSKTQRWLGQCEIAKNRSKVNDNIVNFSNILEDIWDNRFSVDLPSVFKIIANNGPPRVDNPFKVGKDRDSNRQKRKRDEKKSNKLTNDKADDNLKTKKGESWEKIFCVKSCEHRVKWNSAGTLMCPRWFSRQYCFSDCGNKDSHVPNGKVPEEKRKEYEAYLVKIREE